jgi:L-ascorbate metabolism protein UlaG (beta-lactamase superfamily)
LLRAIPNAGASDGTFALARRNIGAMPDPSPGIARVTYVGHATVLVELDGVRLLTDPVVRRHVLHLRRSGVAAPEALRDLNGVLISHAHWDHLDLRSLRKLPQDVRFVVPRDAGRLLRRKRFTDVVELGAGEASEIGGVAVTATYAEHDAGRGPLGPRSPALGYLITGSKRIYFAGDTDLFPEMASLAPVDLALLPVAGWGPRLPAGHLTPLRAAEALRLLRPREAVPIHWGTYSVVTGRRVSNAEARAPAEEFARLASELAPAVGIRVLAPGESLTLT